MLEVLREMCVLSIVISIPMRWLAGKSHEFAQHGWDSKQMCPTLEELYEALEKIQDNFSSCTNKEFMLGLIANAKQQLPPLTSHVEHEFKRKKQKVAHEQ